MSLKKYISKKIEMRSIRNLNKTITKYVSGKRVLDNGSARGSFIYEKHPEKDIYSMDINANEVINKRAKEFKIADSTKLPYKKNEFDCVVFAGVIQYVKDYEKSIEEIKRVLKDNGKLIIASVNRKSLFRRIGLINPMPKPEAGEYQIFSFKELKDLLKKHDFEIKQEKGVDFIPLPTQICSNILIIAKNIK
ncbi:MAG: class I SAM-dependent methyltransferase [Candidatus Pacearchaeota archaeon]|jgi:ubiquinone/menaquinone biosynthesis C-methylase UbiE